MDGILSPGRGGRALPLASVPGTLALATPCSAEEAAMSVTMRIFSDYV
jgi:hypothetical protein